MFPVESSRKVRSVLSIGLTNDIQSPAKDPRLKTKHISGQANDIHVDSSTVNDYDVHHMDTSLAVSCSGSAVERTRGKEPSVTAERRAHTTAAEMASEPLPSNGQRDGQAAERRKMNVSSSHSSKQEQENHGKEGVRYRDRHQKETVEASRHRPGSDDHRSDPRRHGMRDSREKDHHHRNHHRQEQKNGAPVESKLNHTQREHSKYRSSHRDRNRNRDLDYDHRDRDRNCHLDYDYRDRDRNRDLDYDHRDRDRNRDLDYDHRDRDRNRDLDYDHRDRDRNRDLDYDHRDRDRNRDLDYDHRDCDRHRHRHREQIEGSAFQERQMGLDTRFPSTITTSLDENEVYNEEVHCNNRLEIDTQDPHLTSLIEYNAAHNKEYFVKLHQQERQSSKSAASPVANGWSPAETTESPNETTSTIVPYAEFQPRVETTVSSASNAVASTRTEKAVSQSSNPGICDTLNPLPTPITQHRPPSHSSAAPSPSTSNATNPNALSRRTSEASSFSLSSGSDISQPSTSGGHRSLDRRESRSELSPDAQIALDKVKQRNPPVKVTQQIPVSSVAEMWAGYGGSRKRKAHSDTVDVNPLRQRASGGCDSLPSKRSALGAKKNMLQRQKKKYGETWRGRKNWK